MRHPSLIASNSPATLHRGGNTSVGPRCLPTPIHARRPRLLQAAGSVKYAPGSQFHYNLPGDRASDGFRKFFRSTRGNLEVATDPGRYPITQA